MNKHVNVKTNLKMVGSYITVQVPLEIWSDKSKIKPNKSRGQTHAKN